jgi:hypothetical protein
MRLFADPSWLKKRNSDDWRCLMTTVRAFDPYARSKRNHPSAQPAPEPAESDDVIATVLPFRRPDLAEELRRAAEGT